MHLRTYVMIYMKVCIVSFVITKTAVYLCNCQAFVQKQNKKLTHWFSVWFGSLLRKLFSGVN